MDVFVNTFIEKTSHLYESIVYAIEIENPCISNHTIIIFLLQMWNSDLAQTAQTHSENCAFQFNPNRQTENPQFPTVHESAFYDVRSKSMCTIGQ